MKLGMTITVSGTLRDIKQQIADGTLEALISSSIQSGIDTKVKEVIRESVREAFKRYGLDIADNDIDDLANSMQYEITDCKIT